MLREYVANVRRLRSMLRTDATVPRLLPSSQSGLTLFADGRWADRQVALGAVRIDSAELRAKASAVFDRQLDALLDMLAEAERRVEPVRAAQEERLRLELLDRDRGLYPGPRAYSDGLMDLQRRTCGPLEPHVRACELASSAFDGSAAGLRALMAAYHATDVGAKMPLVGLVKDASSVRVPKAEPYRPPAQTGLPDYWPDEVTPSFVRDLYTGQCLGNERHDWKPELHEQVTNRDAAERLDGCGRPLQLSAYQALINRLMTALMAREDKDLHSWSPRGVLAFHSTGAGKTVSGGMAVDATRSLGRRAVVCVTPENVREFDKYVDQYSAVAWRPEYALAQDRRAYARGFLRSVGRHGFHPYTKSVDDRFVYAAPDGQLELAGGVYDYADVGAVTGGPLARPAPMTHHRNNRKPGHVRSMRGSDTLYICDEVHDAFDDLKGAGSSLKTAQLCFAYRTLLNGRHGAYACPEVPFTVVSPDAVTVDRDDWETLRYYAAEEMPSDYVSGNLKTAWEAAAEIWRKGAYAQRRHVKLVRYGRGRPLSYLASAEYSARLKIKEAKEVDGRVRLAFDGPHGADRYQRLTAAGNYHADRGKGGPKAKEVEAWPKRPDGSLDTGCEEWLWHESEDHVRLLFMTATPGATPWNVIKLLKALRRPLAVFPARDRSNPAFGKMTFQLCPSDFKHGDNFEVLCRGVCSYVDAANNSLNFPQYVWGQRPGVPAYIVSRLDDTSRLPRKGATWEQLAALATSGKDPFPESLLPFARYDAKGREVPGWSRPAAGMLEWCAAMHEWSPKMLQLWMRVAESASELRERHPAAFERYYPTVVDGDAPLDEDVARHFVYVHQYDSPKGDKPSGGSVMVWSALTRLVRPGDDRPPFCTWYGPWERDPGERRDGVPRMWCVPRFNVPAQLLDAFMGPTLVEMLQRKRWPTSNEGRPYGHYPSDGDLSYASLGSSAKDRESMVEVLNTMRKDAYNSALDFRAWQNATLGVHDRVHRFFRKIEPRVASSGGEFGGPVWYTHPAGDEEVERLVRERAELQRGLGGRGIETLAREKGCQAEWHHLEDPKKYASAGSAEAMRRVNYSPMAPVRLMVADGDYNKAYDLKGSPAWDDLSRDPDAMDDGVMRHRGTQHVHLFGAVSNPNDLRQAVGRANRQCAFAGMPTDEWTIHIVAYLTLLRGESLSCDTPPQERPDPWSPALGSPDKRAWCLATQEAPDELGSDHVPYLEVLRQTSVDCKLFQDYNAWLDKRLLPDGTYTRLPRVECRCEEEEGEWLTDEARAARRRAHTDPSGNRQAEPLTDAVGLGTDGQHAERNWLALYRPQI